MARRKATDSLKLVEAAALLFRRKGYKNTTIEDVADMAGISKPTVYQYVKSKESLLEHICDIVLTRIERDHEISVASSAVPAQQLRHAIKSRVQAIAELQGYFLILMNEELELSTRFRKKIGNRIDSSNMKFMAILAANVPSNKKRTDINLHAEALFILGMMASMAWWYKPNGPLSAEQLAEHVMAIIAGDLTNG